MNDSRLLSLPEIAGKTLVGASIHEVAPELLLRFSDSTQLSIEVTERYRTDVLYCADDKPDQPILHVELS